MRHPWLPVCVSLFWSGAALAQDAPTIRQFDIPTLEKLGHEMYVQDQAAWHATDALFVLHPQAELQKEKVGGWIVENLPEGTRVRFIRQADSGPEAAYDISYQPGADYARDKPQISEPSDHHLSDIEKAQFSARTLAIKSITQRCGDNYNTIVLKDPEGDGWLAWALAATFNPNLVMMGGHLRLTVSADGKTVTRLDALSRTCTIVNKPDGKDSKQPDTIMVTQLVSDLPVETAVFKSLDHHLPVYVMTPSRTLWRIVDGKIASLGIVEYKPQTK